MSDRQRGYSLVELLVVVGIVGLISLVGVPAFITYFNAARVNSALRELTSDLRGARQRAVARNRPVKVSVNIGAGERVYRIYDGSADLATWTQVGADRILPEYVYLNSTTLTDGDVDPDGLEDVVFRPNGTAGGLNDTDVVALPTEAEDGKQVTKLVVRTDSDVPFNQFAIYFDTSGRVSTVRSRF